MRALSPSAHFLLRRAVDSKYILTASADGRSLMFEVETGQMVFNVLHSGPVHAVGFADGDGFFFTANKPLSARTGKLTLSLYEMPSVAGFTGTPPSLKAEAAAYLQYEMHSLSRAGHFLPHNEAILLGHDDGKLIKYTAVGGGVVTRASELQAEEIFSGAGDVAAHSAVINDIRFMEDRTLFVTASNDCTARLWSTVDLQMLKTYRVSTPVNGAVIHPKFEHLILGGGQDAMSVTTTDAREGGFEARFFNMVYETEFGRVAGHFGPINSLAMAPDGLSYASGAEDGTTRFHKFTADYLSRQERDDSNLAESIALVDSLPADDDELVDAELDASRAATKA